MRFARRHTTATRSNSNGAKIVHRQAQRKNLGCGNNKKSQKPTQQTVTTKSTMMMRPPKPMNHCTARVMTQLKTMMSHHCEPQAANATMKKDAIHVVHQFTITFCECHRFKLNFLEIVCFICFFFNFLFVSHSPLACLPLT